MKVLRPFGYNEFVSSYYQDNIFVDIANISDMSLCLTGDGDRGVATKQIRKL